MDRYYRSYNQALKFALAPESQFRGFFPNSQKPSPGDDHTRAVGADFLEDHDDPRADILRRSLGHTSHPEADDYSPGTDRQRAYHYIAMGTTGDSYGGVGPHSGVSFNVKAKAGAGLEAPPTAVHIGFHAGYNKFTEPSSALGRLYRKVVGRGPAEHHSIGGSGLFTPDEARRIADRLPPEHADAAHQFLDHHFGPRS